MPADDKAPAAGAQDPEVVTREEQLQARQRRAAKQSADADLTKYTETVPGGRYLLDDGETYVDANGKQLKGS